MSAVTRPGRDNFLDGIRAIATVRVIIWHAFGAVAISWFVASIPAMFFVFGSLLAQSVARKPLHLVVKDRLRRTLVPLWGFVSITWLTVSLFGSADASWSKPLTWLLPLVDPVAAEWEGGWLSSPLWFLRMLLWLLALSPLLLFGMKRAPRLTFAISIASVFLTDLAARQQALVPDSLPSLWWKLGDAALYSSFALTGMIHATGVFDRIAVRRFAVVAAVAAVAAVVWRVTQPVPLGVVNNSHPLHLFVGAFWLALAFAFRAQLVRVFQIAPVATVIRFLTQRSMTIYVWHTTVLAGVLWLLSHSGIDFGFMRPIVYLTVAAVGVFVTTIAFGWIEDMAARRKPGVANAHGVARAIKHRAVFVAAAVTVTLTVFASSFVGGSAVASDARPPVPSQPPPVPSFDIEPIATEVVVLPRDELGGALQALLDDWSVEHGTTGTSMSVALADGTEYTVVNGRLLDGSNVSPDDQFDAASATKMMTATLVYQAAERGLIDLDAPIGALPSLPDFPYSEVFTTRQLLSHSTGLVNYRDTLAYKTDPLSVVTPEQAVRVSITEPLYFVPGAHRSYSSVNYLLLGLLLERTYGITFDELITAELVGPLGLTHTTMLPSAPGEPHFSTGGTSMTMADLTHMTRAILGSGSPLSPTSLEAMTGIDPSTAMGAGTIGFCPCTEDVDGNKAFYSIGHYGSDVLTVYVPALGVTVSVRVTEGLHEPNRVGVTSELIATSSRMAAASTAGAA